MLRAVRLALLAAAAGAPTLLTCGARAAPQTRAKEAPHVADPLYSLPTRPYSARQPRGDVADVLAEIERLNKSRQVRIKPRGGSIEVRTATTRNFVVERKAPRRFVMQ